MARQTTNHAISLLSLALALGYSGTTGCNSLTDKIRESASYVTESHLDRSRHVSPQYIARIFEKAGIEAHVVDNKSDRTLIEIGEMHLSYGDDYVEFFKNLERAAHINKIFFEGMPTEGITDSNREMYKHVTSEEDPQGFQRLSRKYATFGVENDDLYHDTIILGKITFLLSDLYDIKRRKDNRVEEEINVLKSKLRTINLPESSYRDIARGDYFGRIFSDAHHIYSRIAVDRRNNAFVDSIERRLDRGEVGALITGSHHVKPEESVYGIRYSTIEPGLTSHSINIVRITSDDVLKYNRWCKDKK